MAEHNPHWLFTSGKSGTYHEQMDAHAPSNAPDRDRYRHRERDPSPEDNHGEWVADRAPGGWL